MRASGWKILLAFAVSSLYLAVIAQRIQALGWQSRLDGPVAPVRNGRQFGTALTSVLGLAVWVWCAGRLLRESDRKG